MPHQHQASKTRGPYGFFHPASTPGARDQLTEYNPRAHGGASYIEVCSCGMERDLNVNGQHEEYGSWKRTAEMRKADAERAYIERYPDRLHRARLFMREAKASPYANRYANIGTYAVSREAHIDVPWDLDPGKLLLDDTEVVVVLDSKYLRSLGVPAIASHDLHVTLGDLRRNAREWAGDKSTEGKVHQAIGRALP